VSAAAAVGILPKSGRFEGRVRDAGRAGMLLHGLVDHVSVGGLGRGVLSTVEAYLQLLEVQEGEARRRAWVQNYEAAHEAIFKSYYSNWGNPERRSWAADRVGALAPTIKEREARAAAAVDRAGQDLAELGLLDDVHIPTVLMVGGYTSNGWVTIESQPALYIALECLPDPPFDDVLALHEAVHFAHLRLAAPDWPDNVGARLHQEGVATAITRRLRPGLSDSAYLWFDDDHEGWIIECHRRETEILRRVGGNFDSTDSRVLDELFGNQPSLLPTRCGYWVGDKIAQTLLKSAAQAGEVLGSFPRAVHHTRIAITALTAKTTHDNSLQEK